MSLLTNWWRESTTSSASSWPWLHLLNLVIVQKLICTKTACGLSAHWVGLTWICTPQQSEFWWSQMKKVLVLKVLWCFPWQLQFELLLKALITLHKAASSLPQYRHGNKSSLVLLYRLSLYFTLPVGPLEQQSSVSTDLLSWAAGHGGCFATWHLGGIFLSPVHDETSILPEMFHPEKRNIKVVWLLWKGWWRCIKALLELQHLQEPELILYQPSQRLCWYQSSTISSPGTHEAGNSHCSLFPTYTELQLFCFGTIWSRMNFSWTADILQLF